MISFVKPERPIVCGVVEGFYGRPWTFNQRTELFERMRSWQMNTYLYAPKDDLKHRQMWRDLYTPEEAPQLQVLIRSAHDNDIMFVYAISPGLDITFSNVKDVDALKGKMKQVMDLGCHAFALLFDDIDPNLNAVDKAKFDTLASAQVFVTNELFLFLNKPRFFLFCPTEYCATRAMPSVSLSEYLNTIGEKLLPNIDIMWTGPKVISKSITIESIEELSRVLRRSPVIWDNIHANDYDQKRLFLGPYCGRSNKLLEKLRGVLTNPNCEFEANFIAVYTLAEWFKHNIVPSANYCKAYDPIDCLDAALSCWMKHLYKASNPSIDTDLGLQSRKSVAQALMATAVGSLPLSTASIAVAATQVLSHEDCTAAVAAVAQQDPSAAAEFVSESLMDVHNNMQASVRTVNDWTTIGNAMVDDDKDVAATAFAVASVVTQAAEKEAAEICESETIQEILHKEMMHSILDQEKISYCEAKECIVAQEMLSRRSSKHESDLTVPDSSVQEPMECSYHTDHDKVEYQVSTEQLTAEHLRLLVDLYYLPYEHGFRAVNMLELVHWLRSHAHLVDRDDDDHGQDNNGLYNVDSSQGNSEIHQYSPCEPSPPVSNVKISHWREKAAQFHQNVERVRELTNLFCSIPNKSVLSDLYSYLQDARHVLEALDSYIKWLERAKIPYSSVCALRRLLSWCTPGYKEMFTGDDYESWMFRGGLISEFQRMFPVDNAYDLFPIRASFIQYSPDFSVGGLLAEPIDPDSTAPSAGNPHNGCRQRAAPRSTVFSVRPYQSEDRASMYSLCLQLVNSRASLSLHDYRCYADDITDLPGDRYIGAFLDFCPTHCLVVESDDSVIIGYGFGCVSAAEFEAYRAQEYNPRMRLKYAKYLNVDSNSDSEMTDSIDSDQNAGDKYSASIQKMLGHFLTDRSCLPPSDHSVVIYFDLKECCKPSDLDSIDSLSRRLLICLFSALKTSTAEVTDQPTLQAYPAATAAPVVTAAAVVSQATGLIATSVPLVTMAPVLQVTSKDRGPIMSLTVFAEVDAINRAQRESYKRYGFTEMAAAGVDDVALTRVI